MIMEEHGQNATSSYLFGVLHNEIHVLVETDDVAFDPSVDVLVQPHRHSRPVLQIAEDQIDRLRRKNDTRRNNYRI